MQTHEVVSVVGGGWSFSQVPHELVPGYVIAVNDSAWHLSRLPDEIVSMDRQWAEHRIEHVIAAQRPTYLRRSAVQNLHAKIHGRPWIHVFDCDNESHEMVDNEFYPHSYQKVSMTEARYRLNGTNSGECAINRAYKIAPQQVFLFGFDMQFGPNGEKHWYPDYGWPYQPRAGKLREWAPHFAAIAEQFRAMGVHLINVNDRSLITGVSTCWLGTLRAMQQSAERDRATEFV